jgi:hypothetical protein
MASREIANTMGEEPAGTPTPTLSAWLAVHGPLSAASAVIVVRQVCADASALDEATLARSTASLSSANILRHQNGEWRWRPAVSSSLDRRPTDNEIVERAGAILFECLTATALSDYLPEPGAVAARLRDHRPDLPQPVVNLTARLASARSMPRITLEEAADDLERATGTRGPEARSSTGRLWAAAGALILAALALWRAAAPRSDVATLSHGLTQHETVLHDLAVESADWLALGDEHTLALDHLKELERMWRERVPAEDARVGLNYLRQGWVRAEAADFLTAEQMFLTGPGLVSRALGSDHPYVRAARLNLAVALDRRGATEAAREQRTAAHATAARLLPTGSAESLEADAGPPMPGVLAHHEPNPPEREGFRLDSSNGYAAPLTSSALLLAGGNGWRLHVGATSDCRVGVDAGSDPRHLEVRVRRQDDAWMVSVDGIVPRVEAAVAGARGGDRATVTVDVAPSGEISILRRGVESLHAVIDRGALSNSPYALTFVGLPADKGCALVWWEVKPRE